MDGQERALHDKRVSWEDEAASPAINTEPWSPYLAGSNASVPGAATSRAANGRRPQPGSRRDRPIGRSGTCSGFQPARLSAKQAPQLDCGRELAALLVGGADRCGLRFGDDEHRQSMGYADRRRQVLSALASAVSRRIWGGQLAIGLTAALRSDPRQQRAQLLRAHCCRIVQRTRHAKHALAFFQVCPGAVFRSRPSRQHVRLRETFPALAFAFSSAAPFYNVVPSPSCVASVSDLISLQAPACRMRPRRT